MLIRSNAMEEEYSVLAVFIGDKMVPVLHTYSRIDPATVPKNLYMFEVREGDDGEMTTIEKKVRVNFGGTIISMIDLLKDIDQPDKYFELTEDNYGHEGWDTNIENYEEYLKYTQTYVGDELLCFTEWDELNNK